MQLDLTQVSTILGLGSVIIGIIGSLYSIWRFVRARKLAIFLEFNRLLYDKEFIRDMNDIQTWTWENVEEFFEKYGPDTHPDEFAKYIRVGSYFDGLATLVYRKFMDYDFIPETTAISIILFWEKFEPSSKVLGEVFRRPGCWDAIKHLYNRLQKTDTPYPRPEPAPTT
ncbi:MAG: DUF4760 domain-containing protein [Candidatus Ranarchaeia archaeon]|jgi:hypothetical protein